MVNLKTKFDKHAQDNEKRCKSLKEKEKAKLNQTQIIKQALSNSCLNNSSSKKIVFKDPDDDGNSDKSEGGGKKVNGNEKTVLFESSGSEDESFEIKEKAQFGGKKGFELLNLQSTYGNDERFKIDERFLENEKDDSEGENGETEGNEKTNVAEEKVKQLRILESVLGQPIVTPEGDKKKKRTFEMVRYDATNKDHERYEVKPQSQEPPSLKKKQQRKKTLKSEKEGSPKPQVSKEKFYEVSSEIKNAFKDKKENGQFSLLQTYSIKDVDNNGEIEEEEQEEKNEEEEGMDQDFYEPAEHEEDIVMSGENEVVEKNAQVVDRTKTNDKVAVAKGIWKESFFFVEDDPRFKEGLEFINKKDSEEAAEAAEKYNQTRRKLKEILRLHMKKQLHKKDPFKNKVGGMNKKQLANSRFKNSKHMFNKQKSSKANRPAKV